LPDDGYPNTIRHIPPVLQLTGRATSSTVFYTLQADLVQGHHSNYTITANTAINFLKTISNGYHNVAQTGAACQVSILNRDPEETTKIKMRTIERGKGILKYLAA
jgi:hypothetical protein